VNDGSTPNCDVQPLNGIIFGDPKVNWRSTGLFPYCLPRRRMREEDKNEAYHMAVDAIVRGRGLSWEQAEAEADQVLGWCPDSIQCGGCRLLIPGCGAEELVEQAREYKWRVVLPLGHESWRCPGCDVPGTVDCPISGLIPSSFHAVQT
jgi:hypothetical protein